MTKASTKPAVAKEAPVTPCKSIKHNTSERKMSSSGLALLSSGKKRITPFQLKVLSALCQVPAGQVTTYKLLSQHVGCRSSQAVGQALRRNPYGPTVPCHRVVAHASGAMCGFGGQRAGAKIDSKLALLRKEGVILRDDGTVDPASIYHFDEK